MLSENKKNIHYGTVLAGIAIQLPVGALMLKSYFFRNIFISLNHVILSIEDATTVGTSFIFGFPGGDRLPFSGKTHGSSFVLAFRYFPLVLAISALSSLLFYWKILPFVVKGFSKALQKAMKLGGAEGLGVAANIFAGMVEAPILIRPYLNKMTLGGMGVIAPERRNETVSLGLRSPLLPEPCQHAWLAPLQVLFHEKRS